MLTLTRMKVERFRNVQPGLELRFHKGLNVLLGQNATGKTTLLELIAMAVKWDFSALEDEEFAIEYDLENAEVGTIAFKLSQAAGGGDKRAEAIINLRELATPHHYLVIDSKGVTESSTNATTRNHGRNKNYSSLFTSIALYFARSQHDKELSRTFYMLINMKSDGIRFDESVEIYRQLFSNQKYPGLLLADNAAAKGKEPFLPDPDTSSNLLYPIQKFILLSEDRDKFLNEGLRAEETEFLPPVLPLLGFRSAQVRVDVLRRSPQLIQLGNLTVRFYSDKENFISQNLLSYGQKRLLTFFYYLSAVKDIIIADELVNGLHHQWIRACVAAIGARQAFLTSQNPLLLDYLTFSSAEQAQRSFVLCRLEGEESQRRMAWSNMSGEDADEFFSAYQLGIEHVNEILQSRGLW